MGRNVVYLELAFQPHKATAAVLLTPRGHDTRKDKFLMPPHATTDLPTIKYCECGCGQPTIRGNRFLRGHGHGRPIEIRFWEKVNRRGPNECWPWLACSQKEGYGVISYQGKTQRAHRIAFMLHHGPIPDGMFVCHACDNPSCVNPAHLWLGRNEENVQDMLDKGRNAVMSGSQSGSAKLSEIDIPLIKLLRAEGLSHRKIAGIYGVRHQTIACVLHGKTWSHVR